MEAVGSDGSGNVGGAGGAGVSTYTSFLYDASCGDTAYAGGYWVCGGGGGGGNTAITSAGGKGGGGKGNGYPMTGTEQNGAANTGGGGGCGGYAATHIVGGNGGSGLVLIRYPYPATINNYLHARRDRMNTRPVSMQNILA
jgi:hypothetical protein